jgi:hypothetical protein
MMMRQAPRRSELVNALPIFGAAALDIRAFHRSESRIIGPRFVSVDEVFARVHWTNACSLLALWRRCELRILSGATI